MTRDFEIIGEFHEFEQRVKNAVTNDDLMVELFQEWTELRDVAGLNDE